MIVEIYFFYLYNNSGGNMADIIDNRKFSEKIKSNYQSFLQNHGLTKEQLDVIRKLKKEKKYDDIFTLYGRSAYLFHTPSKYIKKDIKKLLKKGNFEDIYSKYGATSYNGNLSKMQAIDIYTETNSHGKSFLSKTKNGIVKKVLPALIVGGISFSTIPYVMFPVLSDTLIKENARVYAEEIVSYNARINDYAKQFENLNLSDIQVIMKVMDDMWKDIKGYGNPQKDIYGYGRLDLEPGGVGVCRNMADDVAAKLNVINPEYNARTLTVIADEEKKYTIANIERNVYNPNPTVVGSATTENETASKFTQSLFGNHKVVIMDIPGETYNLIVDPTNPSIGVFVNGKIYTFSTSDGNGISNPHFSQYFDGYAAEFDYRSKVMTSFQNLDLESLRSKWGIEAENKALNEAREIAELALKNTNMQFNSNNTYTYGNDLTIDASELENTNGRTR